MSTCSENLLGRVPLYAKYPSLVSSQSPLIVSHYSLSSELTFGVSVSISHIRQVASPDPVAAYLPVGEWAQHKMGEA